jgi:hypothetical protein
VKKITAALSRCKESKEDTELLFYGNTPVLSIKDLDKGFFGEAFSSLVSKGLVN